MRKYSRYIFVIVCGLAGGAATIWLTRVGTVFGFSEKSALCVLKLQPGHRSASASFTTDHRVHRFHVGVKPGARDEQLTLSINGGEMSYFKGVISKDFRFCCGLDVPPGDFTVALRQQSGSRGGMVVIGENTVGITGNQVFMWSMLGLFSLSAVYALAGRRSGNPRRRIGSAFIFQKFLLAVLLLFLYLLFHEGGHALAAAVFGRFDWAGSDFFGLHGSPHVSLTSYKVEIPWQRATISLAGPMLPTLVGWLLFLFWRSRRIREWRSGRAVENLFFTAIVAMLVFPFVIVPGFMLGLISDGDWRGFIENIPGPHWFIYSLLSIAFIICIAILWRVVPELIRCWRARVKMVEEQSIDRT